MYPRFSPMQSAVSPNPVAAMLPRKLLSFARTLHRSFTRPVSGFACSQKKRKLARSSSSRNASSLGERTYFAGGGDAGGDCGAEAEESWAPEKPRPLGQTEEA